MAQPVLYVSKPIIIEIKEGFAHICLSSGNERFCFAIPVHVVMDNMDRTNAALAKWQVEQLDIVANLRKKRGA